MPSEIRNQKNLSEWIELDYFKRPRSLKRWFNWSAAIVLLLSVAAVAAAVFLLPRSSLLVQAGPVAPSHTMFNHDCAQCHEDTFRTAEKIINWDPSHRAVPDGACVKCHDGPPHHKEQAEQYNCAVCHREHRGRADLKRMPDRECTICHGSLAAHRKDGESGLRFKDVNGFNDDHPEFRLIRDKVKDQGKINFNHKAHLDLLDPKKAPPEHFAIIAGPLKELEKQQCSACHKLDSAGRYMQPINYDRHCAECHPLTVQLAGDFKIAGADRRKFDGKVGALSKVPHGLKPPVVRGVMRDRLLDLVQEFRLAPSNPDDRPGLIDLRVLGKQPTETEWATASAELRPIERLLFPNRQLPLMVDGMFRHGGGCRLCHIEKKREQTDRDLGPLPIYEETKINPRWYSHARFNHQNHRMLACTECHQEAPTSTKTSDLMLPKLESCQQCHNPKVGVRTDCVECHAYHGDHTHETPRNWTIKDALFNR